MVTPLADPRVDAIARGLSAIRCRTGFEECAARPFPVRA